MGWDPARGAVANHVLQRQNLTLEHTWLARGIAVTLHRTGLSQLCYTRYGCAAPLLKTGLQRRVTSLPRVPGELVCGGCGSNRLNRRSWQSCAVWERKREFVDFMLWVEWVFLQGFRFSEGACDLGEGETKIACLCLR